jgi:UDP-N-acetylmuramoyl-L-alanyl-D-glutamate--2,6-diaminopimelate ligase
VVTSDNPRHEDPDSIISDVLEGIEPALRSKVVSFVDRREAIAYAISEADAGDVVVIAGKGHERTQEFDDRTVEFDDRTVARECLEAPS